MVPLGHISPNLPMSSLMGIFEGKISLLWMVFVGLDWLLYTMFFLLMVFCIFEKGVMALYLIFGVCFFLCGLGLGVSCFIFCFAEI